MVENNSRDDNDSNDDDSMEDSGNKVTIIHKEIGTNYAFNLHPSERENDKVA